MCVQAWAGEGGNKHSLACVVYSREQDGRATLLGANDDKCRHADHALHVDKDGGLVAVGVALEGARPQVVDELAGDIQNDGLGTPVALHGRHGAHLVLRRKAAAAGESGEVGVSASMVCVESSTRGTYCLMSAGPFMM